jgi:hypothetical protein
LKNEAVEQALTTAENAVKAGRGLAGTGFWKAVASVKSSPGLEDVYGERIAAIDRRAFEEWALFTVGVKAGTAVMGLFTLLGVLLMLWSYSLAEPWNALVMLGGGNGVLLVTTHGLGHMVVGRMVGIRFTHWFVGSWIRPQPGVKVDYTTYLGAAPRNRAWMHASGALISKVIPFLVLIPVMRGNFPSWAAWILLVHGGLGILTDAVWSVKISDWKKFLREMSYAARVASR